MKRRKQAKEGKKVRREKDRRKKSYLSDLNFAYHCLK